MIAARGLLTVLVLDAGVVCNTVHYQHSTNSLYGAIACVILSFLRVFFLSLRQIAPSDECTHTDCLLNTWLLCSYMLVYIQSTPPSPPECLDLVQALPPSIHYPLRPARRPTHRPPPPRHIRHHAPSALSTLS